MALDAIDPVGIIALPTPMVDVAPPHTCEPSVTVNGNPLNMVTIPDVYQPLTIAFSIFPVRMAFPLPMGS